MNRKILALILALVAVAAAVVLAVTLNHDAAGSNTPDEGAADTAPSVPGVEDSIFEPDPVETREPDETAAPDATENTAAVPEEDIPIPADPQNPGGDVPGATRPVQTEPAETEPKQTEPAVTEPAATEPTQTEPVQTEPVQIPEGEIDYETFTAMDPALQRAYMESFESMDAFFAWYNAAKEAYGQEHPAIDVGDGVIDLEDLLG